MSYAPKGKVFLLVSVVLIYVALGLSFLYLVDIGVLSEMAPSPAPEQGSDLSAGVDTVRGRLTLAESFVDQRLVRDSGHVELYFVPDGMNASAVPEAAKTNSEALSYYLLWTAKEGDKDDFDRALGYVEERMLHPRLGYMQWRLEEDGTVRGDGRNIASDADLRTIKALLVAEREWGEARYTRLIDSLAEGLEGVAVTDDDLLAPYGGPVGNDESWTAQEVYLSYAMFDVFDALADRRGAPWDAVRENMKDAYMEAQIHNGLYNSYLTANRVEGNGIDGGAYSINSLWMMVRAAESGDPELRTSARRSLDFYRSSYARDGELFATYHSSGYPMSPTDTPWVYALVGRAAVALGEDRFADAMVSELLDHQRQTGVLTGAFPEGGMYDLRVGQFTMQESILTLQDYLESQPLKAFSDVDGGADA